MESYRVECCPFVGSQGPSKNPSVPFTYLNYVGGKLTSFQSRDEGDIVVFLNTWSGITKVELYRSSPLSPISIASGSGAWMSVPRLLLGGIMTLGAVPSPLFP